MRKKDGKQTMAKKVARQIKDFIPASMLKNLHPIEHIIPQPSTVQGNEYAEMLTPSAVLPEWTFTSTEEVNAEVYKDETDELFEDPEHEALRDNLPLNLIKIIQNEMKWDRPTTYVQNYYIDKEIQQLYPKKNYTSMREDIKKSFSNRTLNDSESQEDEENDIDNYLKNDAESMKLTIYKDFYKYLEKAYEYKIVHCSSRIETDDEYYLRKANEEKEKDKANLKKGAKKPVKPVKGANPTKVEESEKIAVNTPQPSMLSMLNFKQGNLMYNSFYSWLVSIYQMILDQEISDLMTHKSIISNIYPQKDGAPIYNPKGKYIIKLYCMGKPRKVIIDDRIPCNKEHEFFFPHSSHIEEIWPALFTKALMKLQMYKSHHPAFYLREEFMDPFVIYALTGLHTSIIDINESILSLFMNHFTLKPKLEEEENCYFAFFNYCQTFSMQDKRSYEEKVSDFNRKKKRKDQKYLFNFDLFENQSNANKGKRAPNIPEEAQEKFTSRRIGRNSGTIHQFKEKINLQPSSKFERKRVKCPTIIQKKLNLAVTIPSNQKKDDLITDNNIVVNFLYSISDFFQNKEFNMKRLRYLDFSDLQKQLQEKSILFKQLPLNEKKVYLLARRELKKQQVEEKNKRINELKEHGLSYTLVKIICRTLYMPEYKGFNEYSESELIWAKKCLINQWEFPPVSYFSSYFREIKQQQLQQQQQLLQQQHEKATSNNPNKESKGNKGEKVVHQERPKQESESKTYSSFIWTEEAYIQLIGTNLDKYNICIEPRISPIAGYWLSYNSLSTAFNKMVIVQNQSKQFQNKIASDNSWNYYKSDVFEPLEDHNAFIFRNASIENKAEKYPILIIFEPYAENNTTASKSNHIFPYISFDIFDLSDKTFVKENVILNQFYSVYTFNDMIGEKEYSIILRGGIFPTGYVLQLMAQGYTIENMSMNDYLKQIYQHQLISIKAEHSVIEQNTFWVVARILISFSPENEGAEGACNFKVSIKYPLKYIKQRVMIYLQNSTSQKKKEINADKFINLTEEEVKESQYLLLSLKSEYALKEGAFEIDILYDNNYIKFENIEHIEPYVIIDKYIPNKNRLLFSEYIYPSDKISCSLEIKLRHLIIEESQKKNDAKKGKSPDQGGASSSAYSEGKEVETKTRLRLELYHLTREPTLDFIYESLKFSYSNQGELVYSWNFFNNLEITQLNFEGDFLQSIVEQNSKKKSPPAKRDAKEKEANSSIQPQPLYPYLLICYFDINEVSEDIVNNASGDIGWSIKVFASDLIGFVKDNSKEDHEFKLKENWEENEAGRSLKASKSRKKFLCFDTLKKGGKISKDEEELINEERERRIPTASNEEDNQKDPKGNNALKRNKSPNKDIKDPKDNKKPLPLKKGEKIPVEKPLTEHQKSLSMKNILIHATPEPRDSKSTFVLRYMNYALRERTLIQKCKKDSLILTSELRDRIKQSILKSYEESERQLKSNSLMLMMNGKSDLNESLKSMCKSLSLIRLHEKEKQEAAINERSTIQQNYQRKFDAEKKIKELMKEGPQKNTDINQVVTMYKDSLTVLGDNNQFVKDLFFFVSQQKEENIKNELKKLSQKDQNQVVKLIEDITFNKWEISEDVMMKLKALLK